MDKKRKLAEKAQALRAKRLMKQAQDIQEHYLPEIPDCREGIIAWNKQIEKELRLEINRRLKVLEEALEGTPKLKEEIKQLTALLKGQQKKIKTYAMHIIGECIRAQGLEESHCRDEDDIWSARKARNQAIIDSLAGTNIEPNSGNRKRTGKQELSSDYQGGQQINEIRKVNSGIFVKGIKQVIEATVLSAESGGKKKINLNFFRENAEGKMSDIKDGVLAHWGEAPQPKIDEDFRTPEAGNFTEEQMDNFKLGQPPSSTEPKELQIKEPEKQSVSEGGAAGLKQYEKDYQAYKAKHDPWIREYEKFIASKKTEAGERLEKYRDKLERNSFSQERKNKLYEDHKEKLSDWRWDQECLWKRDNPEPLLPKNVNSQGELLKSALKKRKEPKKSQALLEMEAESLKIYEKEFKEYDKEYKKYIAKLEKKNYVNKYGVVKVRPELPVLPEPPKRGVQISKKVLKDSKKNWGDQLGPGVASLRALVAEQLKVRVSMEGMEDNELKETQADNMARNIVQACLQSCRMDLHLDIGAVLKSIGEVPVPEYEDLNVKDQDQADAFKQLKALMDALLKETIDNINKLPSPERKTAISSKNSIDMKGLTQEKKAKILSKEWKDANNRSLEFSEQSDLKMIWFKTGRSWTEPGEDGEKPFAGFRGNNPEPTLNIQTAENRAVITGVPLEKQKREKKQKKKR